MEDLSKLTVPKLKERLQSRNIEFSKSDRKADLINLLQKSIESDSGGQSVCEKTEPVTSEKIVDADNGSSEFQESRTEESHGENEGPENTTSLVSETEQPDIQQDVSSVSTQQKSDPTAMDYTDTGVPHQIDDEAHSVAESDANSMEVPQQAIADVHTLADAPRREADDPADSRSGNAIGTQDNDHYEDDSVSREKDGVNETHIVPEPGENGNNCVVVEQSDHSMNDQLQNGGKSCKVSSSETSEIHWEKTDEQVSDQNTGNVELRTTTESEQTCGESMVIGGNQTEQEVRRDDVINDEGSENKHEDNLMDVEKSQSGETTEETSDASGKDVSKTVITDETTNATTVVTKEANVVKIEYIPPKRDANDDQSETPAKKARKSRFSAAPANEETVSQTIKTPRRSRFSDDSPSMTSTPDLNSSTYANPPETPRNNLDQSSAATPEPEVKPKRKSRFDTPPAEKEDRPIPKVQIPESILIAQMRYEAEQKEKQQRFSRRREVETVLDPATGQRRPKSPEPRSVSDDYAQWDDNLVRLCRYCNDLNLCVANTGYRARPMVDQSFIYMWAGTKATWGFTKGSVMFEVKIVEENAAWNVATQEQFPNAIRVGWASINCSNQLGEEIMSYGFESSGQKCTSNVFEPFGTHCAPGDVIGAYLKFTEDNKAEINFSKNGVMIENGPAFTVEDAASMGPLFPTILTKNTVVEVNFGNAHSSFTPQDGYLYAQDVPVQDRFRNYKPPESRKEAEVIMMVGLPGAGKTHWARKFAYDNPEKRYQILSVDNINTQMNINGQSRKWYWDQGPEELYKGVLTALNIIMEIASQHTKNYILDQVNVFPAAQERKMKLFQGFGRRAVVVIPEESEYQRRLMCKQHTDDKPLSQHTIFEAKVNFSLPRGDGEHFDTVQFVELDQPSATRLVEGYKEEARLAGYQAGRSRGGFRGGRGGDFGRGGGDRGRGGYGAYRGGYGPQPGYEGTYFRGRAGLGYQGAPRGGGGHEAYGRGGGWGQGAWGGGGGQGWDQSGWGQYGGQWGAEQHGAAAAAAAAAPGSASATEAAPASGASGADGSAAAASGAGGGGEQKDYTAEWQAYYAQQAQWAQWHAWQQQQGGATPAAADGTAAPPAPPADGQPSADASAQQPGDYAAWQQAWAAQYNAGSGTAASAEQQAQWAAQWAQYNQQYPAGAAAAPGAQPAAAAAAAPTAPPSDKPDAPAS